MQYFYIVGYVTNGDDLKLCRVSLNQHELMSWARREATKHDERTDDYIVFKNFWFRKTLYMDSFKQQMARWVFRGTGEELIKKAYQDSEKSGREYERVVRYVESILADEQKEQEK